MIMVTFNCDWTLPEEDVNEGDMQHGLQGIHAIIGIKWRPTCPANDNIPVWLEVYG